MISFNSPSSNWLSSGGKVIFNADQGSQFTSPAFSSMLKANNIRISIDNSGCWRDNVFVKRLWKTIKHEVVYLRAYRSISEARESLARYIESIIGADRTPPMDVCRPFTDTTNAARMTSRITTEHHIWISKYVSKGAGPLLPPKQ